MPETTTAPGLKAVIALARQEAERRGDRRVGTDHLLLALLHDSSRPCPQVLDATPAQGRAALDELDRAALAAIGVHLGEPVAAPPALVRDHRRLPLNSSVRAAMVRAKRTAEGERGGRRVQPRHLLLALLAAGRPDPAAELLTALGVDPVRVRDRLDAV
ncbi:Clp protease N-terminal domain-containing protein [Actinacidiphila yeochonensis]|uniref:Clp protease N-terminal domain-containing protein n=1 Tax=Actinacidiphila yeochonensis TaxID=89050 RepID=UPI00056B0AD1|nr:Clp protease N-terminal domain-containing protein [Actinacidiphila yeochonensis]